MQNSESLNRLKELFRVLFQIDTADLDLGLYRLFRLKRAEIETFLDNQLPDEVEKAFASVTAGEREILQKQVEALARQARESVADDAVLPTGRPNPKYAETKAVKEYIEACRRLEAAEVSEAQQADVFNQLYAFFSRYYDDGDFIPRRFFGARPAYAVPYSGEEVFFHWANKDQYYVKSGEAFRDYAFTVSTLHGEYRVRFKLVEATTPRDNTKGDTRFFFPRPKETAFDKTTRTLTISFEYRLPSESEAAGFGTRNKTQEAILDAATPKILRAVSDDILGAALEAPSATGREAEGETPQSLLRRRLTHFTRKNTTDFFVHKNLGAFLRRELEFFIRDQIVHEADLEGDFEPKRRMLKVFRKLADMVITFLSQVEDAQKRLFEKKKFVLRTDYLVPVQNIPQNLWPEVLANKAQLAEWKDLFAFEPKSDIFNFKGKINEYVLKQHPTLVVDTRHFPAEFTTNLLEAVEDIDEQIDGVLIHGENFQALNLMQERYREHVKCIYIDPPYNTGSDEFVYKDRYQHASWLTMIVERIRLAQTFLTRDGQFFVSMDDTEYSRLWPLLAEVFGEENYIGSFVWKRRSSSAMSGNPVSLDHEYLLLYGSDSKKSILHGLTRRIEDYPFEDAGGHYASTDLTVGMTREQRPGQYYSICNPRTNAEYWPSQNRVWRFFQIQCERSSLTI